MPSNTSDNWNSGDPYELFMGRWSSKMAPKFLDWLQPYANLNWIDIGCGTGALSEAIHNKYNPASITCVDPSTSFLEKVKLRIGDSCNAVVAKSDDLPIDDSSTDIIVSGLALNFFPDLDKSIIEMKRVLKDNGVLAAYVWDYSGRMDMLRYFWDCAGKVDTGAVNVDEGVRFPICNEENLKSLFKKAGLNSVVTSSIDIETPFSSFDEFWLPFLGKQGPAPSFYDKLETSKQNKLIELIRNSLPINPDGSIELIARAFAVSGIK